MDKLVKKRLKQIIENEEPRFGETPAGFARESHIIAAARSRDAHRRKMLKKVKEREDANSDKH